MRNPQLWRESILLIMHFSTMITIAGLLRPAVQARYVLDDDYFRDGNFFDKFSFWSAADPTRGFVEYLDESEAYANGLLYGDGSWGVDNTSVTSTGRSSIRLTSYKAYDDGLVVVDVAHMPGGVCGVWPAFWMVGPDWPYGGEIDIIEGVNDQDRNDMTLHTGPGCSIADNGQFSGELDGRTDCDSSGGDNAGCLIRARSTDSYGVGFNGNGGGVYATEIAGSAIAIWFFPRGSVPPDVESGAPDPSGWGLPLAKFEGDCDIPGSFRQLRIVFDTTFCGDWAGNTWYSVGDCASRTRQSCTAFVGDNPGAFSEAYWTVDSLKVYRAGGGSGADPLTPQSATSLSAPIGTHASSSPAPATSSASPEPWSISGVGPIGSGDLGPSSNSSVPSASSLSWSLTGTGPIGSGDLTPSRFDALENHRITVRRRHRRARTNDARALPTV